MNKKTYLTLLIGLVFSCETFAQSASTGTDLTLSLGNLCEYVGKIQTDEKGDTNVCSFHPYLASSLDYALTSKFFLSPQLGFSIPQSGTDENIKRMTMIALFNTKYKTAYVNMIGGVGFFLTRIWGPGGEAQLNNGTGTDSFPLPKEAIYTRNFILNLGLELDFNKQWSAEIRSYIFNLTNSSDRAVSLGAHATYHFGGIL